MKRIIYLILILLIFSHTSTAQQYGILKGKVFNKENNQPLHSVNLMIKGTLIGTVSDFRGNYSITKIKKGKYQLIVSLIGFQKEIISNIEIESGEEKILDIYLEPAAVQINQVVVTAGKREQTFSEVPASVSVIDPSMIQRRNTVTIDDALRQVSGINLIESQVSIRGSSGYSKGVGSRTLMLVDGIPLLTGDSGELVFESVPTFQVDRIEILKGASSALYGSGAMGGVVNVLTKDIPEDPRTYMRLYGGFYDKTYHPEWKWSSKTQFVNGIYLAHSRRFGDFKTLFGVNRTEDDGFRMNSRWQRWSFYTKNQYQFTPSKNLTLAFNYLEQRRNNFLFWRNLDSALVPPDNQIGDKVISKRYSLSSLFKNTVTDKFLYSIKGVWYRTDWKDNLEAIGNNSRAHFLDAEVQFNYQPFQNHILTFGIEGNVNSVNSNIFGIHTGYNTALYLQDEYKISEQVRLTLGTRFDFSKLDTLDSDYQLNPKLGVAYILSPATSFRSSVGRAFRSPAVSEAFTSTTTSGVTVVPNPYIKSERNWTFELGANHVLTENIVLDGAIFHSQYNNLIEAKFVGPGKGQFINVTSARIQGFEVSAKSSWFDEKFLLNFAYTFIDPKDLNKDEILRFRSKHLFYSSLTYIYFPFTVGFDFRYLSRIESIDREFSLHIQDAENRVATSVLDAHLSSYLKLMEVPLRLSFHINNLLQYNYVELIGNIAPIRNFVFRIETAF